MLTAVSSFGAETDNVNVRVNPLGLLNGVYSVDLDVASGERVTVGPNASFLSRTSNSGSFSGTAIGAQANFYFGYPRLTSSWFVSPYIDLVSLQASQSPYNSASLNGVLFGVVAAYQWFWPSGFNLDVGGSIGHYGFSNTVSLSDNLGDTTAVTNPFAAGFINVELSLGYSFSLFQ